MQKGFSEFSHKTGPPSQGVAPDYPIADYEARHILAHSQWQSKIREHRKFARRQCTETFLTND
jgi:hypothetical protein